MEGKKSFLLYCDMIYSFEALTDEQAGKLIKIVFEYVNDRNPVVNDQLLNFAFTTIKVALKRDLEEWKKICKRNSNNGKAGGRPLKADSLPEKPKKPSGFFRNPENPVKPDKDNDIDKEIEKKVFSFDDLLLEFQKEKPMKRPYLVRMAEIHSLSEKETLELFKNWSIRNEGKDMTISHAENSFNLFLKGNKKEKDGLDDPNLVINKYPKSTLKDNWW